MSNYATPPQLVEDVPYRDLEEMHAFARRWRDEHRGQWFTVPKLSGFCILMKREVYDSIGGLDERFGLGLFNDDDLAERARRAGVALAVALDLFVHHFGSRTFAGNGIDAERLLEENARRYAAKWGQGTPRGRRVALRPWSEVAGSRAKMPQDHEPESDVSRQGAKLAKNSSRPGKDEDSDAVRTKERSRDGEEIPPSLHSSAPLREILLVPPQDQPHSDRP
jgi:hypothetical protein